MVPEEGVARLSLGGHAIGLCGAARGFRAPCPPGASPDFALVGGVGGGGPRPAARRPKPVRPPWTGTGEKTGAGGGGRTLAALRPRDFESRASASSATPAQIPDVVHFYLYTREREKPSLPRKVRAVVR